MAASMVTYAIVRIDERDVDNHPEDVLQDVLKSNDSIEITHVRHVKEDDSWTDQPVLYWP